MIQIKNFIHKVTHQSSKQSKSVVLTLDEAMMLKDEITKLIADNYELLSNKRNSDQIVQVEITGGKF